MSVLYSGRQESLSVGAIPLQRKLFRDPNNRTYLVSLEGIRALLLTSLFFQR